jgi:hypothetical protein
VSLYASLGTVPDISGLSPAQALALLSSLPGDRLSLVKGWRSERLPLDAYTLARLPPVLIINFSLHGFALPPTALPFIQALWPDFAEHHDETAWVEGHVPELFAFYGRVAGISEASLDAFMEGLGSLGIGSAEDLSLTGPEALAVITASRWKDKIPCWAGPGIYEGLSQEARAGVAGFKLFLDGSLGARTAAIACPYLGGGEGELLYSLEDLERLLASLHGEKKAISIHAIGGLAIEEAILAFEDLHREGLDFPMVRLEHVQFISHSQAWRARDLGLVLSMQANFNSDSVDYLDRLPRGFPEINDPFRLLIDGLGFTPGKDLILGSDGMPQGLEYALRWSLFPAHPGQALSLEEFAAGYGPALGSPPSASQALTFEANHELRTLTLHPSSP